MLQDIKLEDEVCVLIYELMMVMYQHGIRKVHVGGMMRMLGVPTTSASIHDDEVIILDDKFAKYLESITEPISGDQTIH